MVKQPAWAAAISSSGLVPTPSSKRVLKLYCASLRVLLCVLMVPLPAFKSPCQIAVALRSIAFSWGRRACRKAARLDELDADFHTRLHRLMTIRLIYPACR